jgi:hypothetical protein
MSGERILSVSSIVFDALSEQLHCCSQAVSCFIAQHVAPSTVAMYALYKLQFARLRISSEAWNVRKQLTAIYYCIC